MTNPVRSCVGCLQEDDHPRHTVDTTGVNVHWHFDCHAAMTDCYSCKVQLADAPTRKLGKVETNVIGEELREHLVSLGPIQWTHHADGTAEHHFMTPEEVEEAAAAHARYLLEGNDVNG